MTVSLRLPLDTLTAATAAAVRTELTPELSLVDAAVSTRATPADVTAAANASSTSTVTALQASLTSIAQQITDLAAAEVDDATATQLTDARDQILSAVAQVIPTPSVEVS